MATSMVVLGVINGNCSCDLGGEEIVDGFIETATSR
jgi:hypothetical protein